MSVQTRHTTHPLYETAPATYQTVKFLTAAAIGATLTVMTGLTLTATVLALIMVTPLLVLFSPILVPAAVVAFLTTAGFVLSGGFGVAALVALTWLYRYATGKHPVGADQLDQVRMKIASKVQEFGHVAQDHASNQGGAGQYQRQGYAAM